MRVNEKIQRIDTHLHYRGINISFEAVAALRRCAPATRRCRERENNTGRFHGLDDLCGEIAVMATLKRKLDEK